MPRPDIYTGPTGCSVDAQGHMNNLVYAYNIGLIDGYTARFNKYVNYVIIVEDSLRVAYYNGFARGLQSWL